MLRPTTDRAPGLASRSPRQLHQIVRRVAKGSLELGAQARFHPDHTLQVMTKDKQLWRIWTN